MQKKAAPQNHERSHSQPHDFPLVSARWIIWAFLAAMLVAASTTYLALCFLFYQGQWQILFNPRRSLTSTPATAGVAFDDVRFDYTETGVAQLDGWWIPAASRDQQPMTVLFLHGVDGSLSRAVPQLKLLHSLGIDLFAIDYRGFGTSADMHPSEQRVYEDADAAVAYLRDVRHVEPSSIVVYGVGLGATIAAETARRHPGVAALVLEDPASPALTLVSRDPRTKLLPVKLLFHDRFELAPKLKDMAIPKLLIQRIRPEDDYFPSAAQPKELLLGPFDPSVKVDPHYIEVVRRFLSRPRPG